MILEEVHTPGVKTIEALSKFLGVSANRTLKSIFYYADEEMVSVIIRGDLEVNEVKLKNALHCRNLRLAGEAEVIAAGLVAGSASPVSDAAAMFLGGWHGPGPGWLDPIWMLLSLGLGWQFYLMALRLGGLL